MERERVFLLLEIPLNYSEGVLYRQLAEHLEKMIRTGSISSGERLPGTRELARMLRVSRCTVVAAYDVLEEKRSGEEDGEKRDFCGLSSS